MLAAKVGIREFRENLASYLEAPDPVAITRHGETIGFFIPTRRRQENEDILALRSAAERLDSMLQSAGVSEDELVGDFKKARRRRAI
jgi:antitoxin (DNA-binding transcriptional repressor) of toxin-antitoxin stability system